MKWLPLLLGCVGAGCVSPTAALKHATPLSFEAGGQVTVFSDGAAPAEVERVVTALTSTDQQRHRWGPLTSPVTLWLLPTHDALATAVHRNFGWLRAWARFDELYLQTPGSWARPGELEQLLVHELTHVVLFQRAGTKETWRDRQIPLWFREGMALWTAKQEPKSFTLEDLARWLADRPDGHVFDDAEQLAADHFEEVYGLSFYAFSYLLRAHGQQGIDQVIDSMKTGLTFAQAFMQTFNEPAERFEQHFTTWLHDRHFRDEKLAR